MFKFVRSITGKPQNVLKTSKYWTSPQQDSTAKTATKTATKTKTKQNKTHTLVSSLILLVPFKNLTTSGLANMFNPINEQENKLEILDLQTIVKNYKQF